jgi:hypothetical protein
VKAKHIVRMLPKPYMWPTSCHFVNEGDEISARRPP